MRWFYRYRLLWRKRLRITRTFVRDVITNLRMGNEIRKTTDFANCRRPILLLYGFGSTRRALRILELRLRRKTGRCVFSLNLGGYKDTLNTAGIARLAELVDEKVERVCQRYGIEEIDVVAHSKGGLIARHYVQHRGGAKRVRHVVTLATPHQGTWTSILAILLFGWFARSVYQMTPLSPFIRSLQKTPWPEEIPLTSVSSDADWIAPPSRCKIEPRQEQSIHNVTVGTVSHAAMLYSKEVFEHVVAGLGLSPTGRSLTSMSDSEDEPAIGSVAPAV